MWQAGVRHQSSLPSGAASNASSNASMSSRNRSASQRIAEAAVPSGVKFWRNSLIIKTTSPRGYPLVCFKSASLPACFSSCQYTCSVYMRRASAKPGSMAGEVGVFMAGKRWWIGCREAPAGWGSDKSRNAILAKAVEPLRSKPAHKMQA